MPTPTFLGLRTTVYFVSDLTRAKAWYQSLLGIAPYYDSEFYVGFNVGGFELGLHPSDEHVTSGPGGAITYWGVPNLDDAWKRLLELGATAHGEPQDVGGGIRLAAVRDPFDNLFGVIENPHFPNQA